MLRRVEQFNGREGETATLLLNIFGELKVACWRFRPTSSQPFGTFWLQSRFRKMRKIIFGILLIFTFAFGAQDTLAQCCCFANVSEDIRGSRYATAYEELKNSDAVFYGQVVEMKMIDRKPDREGASNYEVEIKFKVEKAWRRDLNEFITLREYSDGCGIGFDIAARWLVYAYLDASKNFRTGYCTRTRVAYKNLDKDFKEFEERGEKQTKIIKASSK